MDRAAQSTQSALRYTFAFSIHTESGGNRANNSGLTTEREDKSRQLEEPGIQRPATLFSCEQLKCGVIQ